MFLSSCGIRATIKEYVNKQHTNLHIQLNSKDANISDFVSVAIGRLKKDYDFNWGFVSEADKALTQSISSQYKIIYIDIFNINAI